MSKDTAIDGILVFFTAVGFYAFTCFIFTL